MIGSGFVRMYPEANHEPNDAVSRSVVTINPILHFNSALKPETSLRPFLQP